MPKKSLFEERLDRTVKEIEELVNHPAHYGGDTTYEAIKVIEAWGLDKSFCLGNCAKYLCRAGKKNGHSKVQDLEKSLWYLNRALENAKREEESNGNANHP